MNNNKIKISGEEFNKYGSRFLKVAEFKNFAELAKKKESKDSDFLYHGFFSTPIINRYLTRKFDEVKIENGEVPQYTVLEKEIYDELKIAYRHQHLNSYNLYNHATTHVTSSIFMKRLRDEVENTRKADTNSYKGVVVAAVDNDYIDIEKMLIIILLLELNEDHKCTLSDEVSVVGLMKNEPYTYVIFPAKGPGHMITMMAIMDNNTNKLASLYIFNSFDNPEVNKIIEEIAEKMLEREVNLINCNLNIQVNQGDGNCGIYSYKIAKALVKMLKNSDSVFRKKLVEEEKIDNEAIRILLKQELPKLYKVENEKIVERDYTGELKPYFLRKRWKEGQREMIKVVQESKKFMKDNHFSDDNSDENENY